jgi:hypothetical protein
VAVSTATQVIFHRLIARIIQFKRDVRLQVLSGVSQSSDFSLIICVYTSLKIRADFLPISRTATETAIEIGALSTLKVRVYLFFFFFC